MSQKIERKRKEAYELGFRGIEKGCKEYYGFVEDIIEVGRKYLNYFIDWVSSGFVEGVNNKIKLIKRKALWIYKLGNLELK